VSKRSVRRVEGSIVAVPLDAERQAFGRLLKEPLVEFYDLVDPPTENADVDRILAADIVFRIDVMNSAVTSGRWKVVGAAPLSAEERDRIEYFFKQDPISGALTVYWEEPGTGEPFERAASREECLALERAAVWSAEHVEDRLRDFFDGRPNEWVASLRPK
jgi:hypothetical protein